MNQQKKIICVFGTRPEAIKMAPLVLALKKEPRFVTKVVLTAQHRQMLDQVMELFEIQPDHDLNIMLDGQSLYHVSTKVLTGIGQILQEEKPDLLLVHGDTTTTCMAALAGYYEKVPVGHVEAGLRSFDKHNPFPEEINRVITDNLCDIFFAPTASSKQNLLKANIKKNVFITGNTVIDALLHVAKKRHSAAILKKVAPKARVMLVTVHRRENWGTPLANICKALATLADSFPDIEIILPVHPNPHVKNTVYGLLARHHKIHLCEPLDYPDLVSVLKSAHLVLTDSGGLQEEAPALAKPVLVMRKVTERPEAVEAGTARIVGTETRDIVRTVTRLLESKKDYTAMANAVNPYGDGSACKRIVESIKWYFGMTKRKPSEFNAK